MVQFIAKAIFPPLIGNNKMLKCLLDWGGNTEIPFLSLEGRHLGRNPKLDELNSKSPVERLLVFEDGIL